MSQSPDFAIQTTGAITGLQYTLDLNQILAALGSQSKGPIPPLSPIAGQTWIDDSGSTWIRKVYDGADWILDAYINPVDNLRFDTENVYLSIASAGTTDLGAVKSKNIIISGAATITSFGVAPAGTRKLVRATGLWSMTFSSSMIGGSGQTSGSYTVAVGQLLDCISQGGGIWNIGFLSLNIASRTIVEAGIDLTGAISPGRAQYHLSAVKAWCYFNGNLTGTNPPIEGYNVTSITRAGTGRYLINWTVPFLNVNYCVVAMSLDNPSTAHSWVGQGQSSITVNQFSLNRSNSGGVGDDGPIYLVAFGRQA